MKFLADENIGLEVVSFLRSRHHNVSSVLEMEKLRGSSDDFLASLANREKRVILTLDKDFGELIFKKLRPAAGVVLLRLLNERQQSIIEVLEKLLKSKTSFRGNFVVVSEDTVRIRPIK